MIGYLARDLYRLAFQFDLAFGIFMLVIGLIMVLKSSIVIRFANFALGIVVLTDGLFKMQMSVDAEAVRAASMVGYRRRCCPYKRFRAFDCA